MPIPIKEPISDNGTTSMTINALRQLCKNRSITTATSNIASIRSENTERIDSRVNVDVSDTVSTLRPCDEYVSSRASAVSITRLLSSIAFASPCLKMFNSTASLPFTRAILTTSVAASLISAISERRIWVPAGSVIIARLRISSTLCSLPDRRIEVLECSFLRLPVGKSRLAARITPST